MGPRAHPGPSFLEKQVNSSWPSMGDNLSPWGPHTTKTKLVQSPHCHALGPTGRPDRRGRQRPEGSPQTSWSRCRSLDGRVGGKWSRKACCFRCRREGTNLQETGSVHHAPNPSLDPLGGQAAHALPGPLPCRGGCLRRPWPCPTHGSLQMQTTGLIRSPSPAQRRRPTPVGTARPPGSASCGPFRSRMLRRMLTAA